MWQQQRGISNVAAVWQQCATTVQLFSLLNLPSAYVMYCKCAITTSVLYPIPRAPCFLPTVLLACLQQHAASLELFAAYCGSPCVEAALDKLKPVQTLLNTMILSACSSSAVQLMSGLTSLTYCEILAPHDKALDLNPLKELANLQKLYLTNSDLNAAVLPAHLTNLTNWKLPACQIHLLMRGCQILV